MQAYSNIMKHLKSKKFFYEQGFLKTYTLRGGGLQLPALTI